MNSFAKFWIVGVLLSVSTFCCGQFATSHLNNHNGLDNELVKCSALDTLGFLWIATDGGLFRYDGSIFYHFADDFASPYLKWIHRASDGSMYLTCDAGVYRADYTANDVAIELLIPGHPERRKNHVSYPKEIFEDSKGRIWIADDFGVGVLEDLNWQYYDLGVTKSSNSFHRAVSFVEVEEDFYAITQLGTVFKLDGEGFTEVISGQFRNVYSAKPWDKGKVLLAAKEGVILLDPANGYTVEQLSSEMDICHIAQWNERTLLASWTHGIFELRHGDKSIVPLASTDFTTSVNHILPSGNSLWLGSDDGLIYLEQNMFTECDHKMISSYVSDVAPDEHGGAWIAAERSIYYVDQHQNVSHEWKHKHPINQLVLWDGDIHFGDEAGKIWRWSSREMHVVHDFSSIGEGISLMTEDNGGNLWIAQEENPLLYRHSPTETTAFGSQEGLFTSHTLCVTETPDGDIIVGCVGKESNLFRLNSDSGQFENISLKVDFADGLDFEINEIDFVGNTAYVASNFGLIEVVDSKWKRLNLGPLTTEDIKCVVADEENIWFGASHGLIRLNGGKMYTYDSYEGLPTKTLAYRGLTQSPGENPALWIATAGGLAHLAEAKAIEKSPEVRVSTVTIDDRKADFASLTELTSKSYLKLDFTSPIYPSTNASYQWRLVGEPEWKAPSFDQSILLNNLEPGQYAVEIRAKRRGNFAWSDPTVSTIKVTQIWFETLWFASVCVIALTLAIYIVVRVQKIRFKRKARLLNKLVQERTRDLEKAKLDAEASATAKSEFLSIMSHEIRTPMNAVIGITNLLLYEEMKDDHKSKLQSMKFSAENLLGIINDILDFSKIESGKLEIEKRAFGLRQFVRNLHMGLDHRATDKGITLNYEIDDNVPDIIVSDRTRMSQILVNLVNNAIKFTHEGGVKTKIECVSKTNEEAILKFSVIDTGIGISEEAQKNVFDTFKQANSSTTRKFGGTGLGLTIAKRLVELLGGDIRLKSAQGTGSEFSFNLWLEYRQGAIVETNAITEFGEKLNGLKVLLAEDNELNILVASSFLKKWNIEVDVARNGKEALDLYLNSDYDIVLMDLQMPEMDGYEATQKIRNHERTRGSEEHIPIVALTASALIEAREKVLNSGMDGFVTKPFKPEVLFEKLYELVKGDDE